MNLVLPTAFCLFLSHCTPLHWHQAAFQEYGQQNAQTIRVTVGHGFKQPGVYHLPPETTVRELLTKARMLPDPGKGSELGSWNLKLVQPKNGFNSWNKITDKELNVMLQDGAHFSVQKING